MGSLRRRPSLRALLLLLAGALALSATAPGMALAAPAAPRPAATTLGPLVRPGAPAPKHFRMTADQALRIAAAQPAVRRALARNPGLRPEARVPDLGLWVVRYRPAGPLVEIEDRTGDILEPSAWSWPQTGTPMSPFKRRIEWIGLALSALFLAALVDRRRLWSLQTLDGLALTAGFGLAFAFFDRDHPLVAVPLVYPVLLYLFGRMVAIGLGRASAPRWSPPPLRLLVPGLLALAALRTGFNLLEGPVNDVGYAGVVGADSIIHGWPLYTDDANHLDTYGPVAYLVYVPFSLLFPMDPGWTRDGLAAAHATSVTIDLLTLVLLVLLGRRLRPGREGTHLGVALAFLFAACPWTFLGLALSTNDGLVGLLLVATLLALRSAPLRGAMLGLAAAAKLSPAALLPLVAAGGGWRPGRVARSAIAFCAVVGVSFLAYLPDGGLHELWNATIGFQLHRRSFLSIWGQHPGLAPLQALAEVAVLAFGTALAFAPRRRDVAQVAALAAALVIGLEVVVRFWTFVYVGWFAPLAIVALTLRGDRVPVEAPEPAPAATPLPAATGATPLGSSA